MKNVYNKGACKWGLVAIQSFDPQALIINPQIVWQSMIFPLNLWTPKIYITSDAPQNGVKTMTTDIGELTDSV